MPTRKEVKQLIIDFEKDKRAAWLQRARHTAYRIVVARGEVCADDIHRYCPLPRNGIDPRIMGAVFHGMKFIRWQKSERSKCHYRTISVFGLPMETPEEPSISYDQGTQTW